MFKLIGITLLAIAIIFLFPVVFGSAVLTGFGAVLILGCIGIGTAFMAG